ncbi:MAG: hypothetical protein ABI140_21890 [Jatrophihabitantaceae bacterium]
MDGRVPAWLVLIVVPVLAGCAGHAGRSARSRPPIGPAPESRTAAGYGRDAASLTVQVAGCSTAHDLRPNQIASISPALGRDQAALAAVATASSCVLKGHPVLLLAFTDVMRQQVTAAAARSWDAFYAAGSGWLAIAQDSQPGAAQESTVQSVAAALDGHIVRGAQS